MNNPSFTTPNEGVQTIAGSFGGPVEDIHILPEETQAQNEVSDALEAIGAPVRIPPSEAVIEAADFQTVLNPGNMVIFPDPEDRGQVLAHLQKRIQTNEYGLPHYWIRSDLLDLPSIAALGRTTQDTVDMATEVLEYNEGYPTFSNGSPFWTQMVHEPHNCFLLFQRYLELAELEGIRLLDTLARLEQVELKLIRQMYYEFFWSSRAKAHDLFVVAADAKRREVRIRKSENRHFESANTILGKVIERINAEPDLINDMDAKELFDLFEQMIKIQRLSLGLVGQHASSMQRELTAPGMSSEVIIRKLTQNSGGSEQTADGLAGRLAVLMSDEKTALTVQELIVRTTTNNK